MATEFIDVRSVVTVISFLTFLGIVWWSWSGRRKDRFDEAAQLPFADMDETENPALGSGAAAMSAACGNAGKEAGHV